jgi:uncharacterized protein YyaL (SSP411 family)
MSVANHLAHETSPYLLQHAHNPVDWYPWGEEALNRARAEDKPILLSIGYSACHWCHVMAHESFENEAIAIFMNQHFVNIKVDREERPDLDHVYMEAVQAMTSGGGWPLTVFATPEGKPFYGGTYFPPQDRGNLPGFISVLSAVVEAYRQRRPAINQTTAQIEELLTRTAGLREDSLHPAAAELSENILKEAYSSIEQCYDWAEGGFGGAPKFPNPLTIEFLLRYYARFKEKRALEMALLAIKKMAGGGIYDQIGGGFHRYSTDAQWLVPHFEKMLYDNALLTRIYLYAYQITGEKMLADVVRETVDYVIREMLSPEGAFDSSQDADSEGEEGKYYLWTSKEIDESLESSTAAKMKQYFEVSAEGNFEAKNILHRQHFLDDKEIEKAKKELLAVRSRRVRPGRDEKALASWNGMMLAGLAEAAGVLQRQDYREAAVRNGEFLLSRMMPGGGLKHSYKDGTAKIEGFLEDYAAVAEGFMRLHQLTMEGKWLKAAVGLINALVNNFVDNQNGLLYDARAGQDLFVRPRNDSDGAVPAGSSMAVMVLLKAALLTGESRYREIARNQLISVSSRMAQVPLGYSQWLCSLDYYLSSPKEVVVIGSAGDLRSQNLLDAIYSVWTPNLVFAALDPADPGAFKDSPLLEGRQAADGQPKAYVCRNSVCQRPVTEGEELRKELES